MLLSAKRGRSGKGGLLCLERTEWRAASAFLLDATEVLKHQVAGDIKILTESAQHSPISCTQRILEHWELKPRASGCMASSWQAWYICTDTAKAQIMTAPD